MYLYRKADEISRNQKKFFFFNKLIDEFLKLQQSQHEKLTLTNLYNVLEKLRKEEPLTKKEQETHQQGLVAILKELHDDLDRAVFSAYGWDDLAEQLVGQPGATTPYPDKPEAQAAAEEELLSRLVDLNAERAAEEAQGNIRWLRPEFQAPEAVTATTSDIETAKADTQPASDTKTTAPEGKLNWPKVLQDQIKAVREQLALAPLSADALAGQFKRKPKGVQDVLDALVALGVVTEEEQLYRLV